MHGRGQRIEHRDLMPQGQEPVAGVRADEPGAAGDEDLHFRLCSLRSAASRYISRSFGVAMAQNTLAEISSGLIREWRTYWARECITA